MAGVISADQEGRPKVIFSEQDFKLHSQPHSEDTLMCSLV